MAHDKVYVVCENMCMEEGMTKEQIEARLSVKENTVKIPFTIKLQKKVNGSYSDAKTYSQNLNVPVVYAKCINNIVATFKIQISTKSGITTLESSYSSDGKTLNLNVPETDVSGLSTDDWRLLAQTSSVPDKYEAYTTGEAREDEGYPYIFSFRINITMYLPNGYTSLQYNYFGTNSD